MEEKIIEIRLFLRDYKALLKFKRFVQHYYPNYHICSKCGELVPINDVCINCKNIEYLNEKIGLKVEHPNNTKQLINQLKALNEWNGKR